MSCHVMSCHIISYIISYHEGSQTDAEGLNIIGELEIHMASVTGEFHTMSVIVISTWVGNWEFYTVSVTGSFRGVSDSEFHTVSVNVSSTRCRWWWIPQGVGDFSSTRCRQLWVLKCVGVPQGVGDSSSTLCRWLCVLHGVGDLKFHKMSVIESSTGFGELESHTVSRLTLH